MKIVCVTLAGSVVLQEDAKQKTIKNTKIQINIIPIIWSIGLLTDPIECGI